MKHNNNLSEFIVLIVLIALSFLATPLYVEAKVQHKNVQLN